MDFSSFLRTFISEQGITNAKIAEQLNVPSATISHLLSGRNKPSLDFIQKFISTYPSIDLYEITGLSKYNNIKNSKTIEITKKQEETTRSTTNANKKVKKIVLLYEDNTFEEYNY